MARPAGVEVLGICPVGDEAAGYEKTCNLRRDPSGYDSPGSPGRCVDPRHGHCLAAARELTLLNKRATDSLRAGDAAAVQYGVQRQKVRRNMPDQRSSRRAYIWGSLGRFARISKRTVHD